jgi:hypothetical protein
LKVIFIYKTMEQKKDCLRHTKLLEIIAPDWKALLM